MPTRLTSTQWLICVIAAIGFAFDIYELLMLPLIVAPALAALVKATPGTDAYNYWVGMLFWIPAIAGGIFGLLGGYLTDRLGRRRVLTWSILIYAFSAFAAGYSTNIWQFLFFRCTTFIGVCVEFVAAVAWLAEIFTDPKQRERVLGYTQAFSSVGGAMVTAANAWILVNATSLPQIYGGNEAWRYTLMSGVIPALPLIIIRPFLPESPVWQQKKAAGTLRRPSLAEIFSPQLRRVTIVTTLMFAMSYGAAFGAIQHMPRIVPGTPEVATLAPARPMPEDAAGAAQWRAESGRMKQQVAAGVQWWQEIGGLAGRTLLAMLLLVIVSRRGLLRVFQVPGLIVVPLVFWLAPGWDVNMLKIGMFFAGLFTVAQFSFWGNYLPRVFPTHLRGTGEGFAANVGGRMLGTGFALVTTTLVSSFDGPPHVQLAKAAAVVAAFVYVCGFALSFFLPEPKGEELPE
jgi:MFS family permease